MKNLLIATFTVFSATYLIVIAAMFFMQNRLLYDFKREMITPEQQGVFNAQILQLNTPDGEILPAWYAAPAPNMPTIIFFHGKGGNISGRPERFGYYTSKGYGVLFPEYRGDGSATGKPSEKGLIIDAETAYDWVKSQGVPESKILVSAESFGTGIATILASRKQIAALSLQAPYSSVADVAAKRYWWVPVQLLLRDKYDAIASAPKINCPLLVQHGDLDETIPIEFGRKLFAAAAEPKQFVVIPGAGHQIFNHPTWERELAFFASVFTLNSPVEQ